MTKTSDRHTSSLLVIQSDRARVEATKAQLQVEILRDWEIVAVDSLASGVRELRRRTWDCILLDLHLTDAKGIVAVRTVTTEAGAAVLLILARPEEIRVAETALRHGARDYVLSGVDPDEMLPELIVRSVERRRRFSATLKSGRKRHVHVDGDKTDTRVESGAPAALSVQSAIPGAFTPVAEDVTLIESPVPIAREQSRQYLDIVEVVFLTLDADGAVSLINRKGCNLLGYSEQELLGKDWFETCIPEAERESLRKYFDSFMSGEEAVPELHENGVVTRNGEFRYIRWRNAVLREASGRIVGVLSSGEDISEQKKIEAEIRDSRELLELALWGADLGAWEWNIADDVIILNERARNMLGYEHEEIPSFKALRLQILPADDVRRLRDEMELHLNGKTPFYQAETWMICRSGEWKWVLERGKVVERDESGAPIRVAGTLLDLTERKYAEIAIEDSEKKFRLLAENSSDVIWTSDHEFKLTFVSPSVEYILGYSPTEFMQLDFRDFLVTDSYDATMSELQTRIKELVSGEYGERSIREEIQIRKKDASLLWVEVVATPIFDRRGRFVSLHGNTRDIHKRKLAQLALTNSEEKYRLLVENQTDLLVKLDLDGRFLFVSHSYCKLFDRLEEELIGTSFLSMVHEDDRNTTLEAMQALTAAPYSAVFEQRARTRDGWRWVAWSDTALLDAEGNIYAIIGVGRDITERKIAERALIDSEKKLRTVISNLPVILFSFDADRKFTLSEGKGLDALGLAPGQVVGKSYSEVYGDNPLIMSNLEQVFAGEALASIVHIEDKSFETWYSPLPDENGNVYQVIGVAVDITERVRTQRELDRHRNHLEELVEARTLELQRASERLKRFRFALDSAADNIYIIDPVTMTFVDINDSAAETLDYSRQELLTMSLADIVPSEEKERVLKLLREVLDGKVSIGILETIFQRKDGTPIPVEILVRAFSAEGSSLLIATVRDITRRLVAERALKESETKYRTVLEYANEGIVVIQDFLLKFFNHKVNEFTGLSEDVLLDLPLFEFIHPADHEMVRDHYRSRLRGDRLPEGYHVRMFDSNGTIKWMEVRDVMISWEGKPATLNFFNDITARKHAEEYMQFQASLLSIVRNSVVALDPAGRIVYWNVFAETMYGWTASEVKSMNIGDVPVFGPEFMREVMPVLRKTRSWEGEVERRRRDGSKLPVYSRWNSIEIDGRVTGYVGIGIDLTERKRLERELLQSQKLASLGILSEGIAHELRNPLGYASSAAQLLLSKRELSEEQMRKYGSAIYSGVEKANKIIENLLLIGKPKGQLMKSRLDLAGVVSEAQAMLSSNPLAAKVTLHSELHEDAFLVLGNREMLVQLFYNLFTNSLNAMMGEGSLHVRGTRKDGRVLVRVNDTGPGIPSDISENIFDPFFTASKSDKGVGLGLTLCYFIMDDHDGKIELVTDKRKEGEGAVFLLTFPST